MLISSNERIQRLLPGALVLVGGVLALVSVLLPWSQQRFERTFTTAGHTRVFDLLDLQSGGSAVLVGAIVIVNMGLGLILVRNHWARWIASGLTILMALGLELRLVEAYLNADNLVRGAASAEPLQAGLIVGLCGAVIATIGSFLVFRWSGAEKRNRSSDG